MPSPPHRIQPDTPQPEAYSLINDNFDKVIQDIRDLGANLSTTGIISVTVAASSLTSVVYTLTSQGVTSSSVNQVFTQSPASAVSGIAPQLDIYVDTDNDITKLFPLGSGLTAGQVALYAIVTVSNTGYTNSLGAWFIEINNRDTVSHTYYLHTRCGYFPSGRSGVFQ